jgi:hypothetical protein
VGAAVTLATTRVTQVSAPGAAIRRCATAIKAGTAVNPTAVASRTTTAPPSAIAASSGSAKT